MALYHSPRIVTNGLVLCVDAANGKSALNSVEVLVVAGGGGGGTGGGGGGGGGVLYSSNYSVTPGAAITVTVGNGGTNTSTWGGNGGQGGNSVFGNLTAIGGGAGGHRYSSPTQGLGGSGGGNAGGSSGSGTVTMANGTAGQGFAGGSSIVNGSTQEEPGGGGGGAGGPGANSTAPVDTSNAAANSAAAGAGGIGVAYDISGTLTYYGGGGGGSNRNGVGASGGLGGGGAGGASPVAGTNGLGGGGGGTGYSGYGGGGTSAVGGSGVVIVRYLGPQRATGGTVTSANNYTIHTFSSVGTTNFTPDTWYDVSPSRNTGTLTNGVGFGQSGTRYFEFDGINDYINFSSTAYGVSIGDTISELTINAWVYWNSFPTNTIDEIVSWWATNSQTYLDGFLGTSCVSNGGGTNANPMIRFGDDWANTGASFTASADVNKWWCITAVKTSNNAYIYKNAVLAATKGSALNWGFNDNLAIGRQHAAGEYLNGRISSIQLYNRALSQAEILQNFQSLRGRFGI